MGAGVEGAGLSEDDADGRAAVGLEHPAHGLEGNLFAEADSGGSSPGLRFWQCPLEFVVGVVSTSFCVRM